jgi:hypothetical protein
MVSKYYVAIRSLTNKKHAVHKEDCPFLPDDEKRIFLGYFHSGRDALRESEKHFRSTGQCRFCMNEYQKHVFSKIDVATLMPTEKQLSQADKGTACSFLN